MSTCKAYINSLPLDSVASTPFVLILLLVLIAYWPFGLLSPIA